MKKLEQTVPNLRFKGFTDDWEQRKLENIGKIVTGNTPSKKNKQYYLNGKLPFVSPIDINNNRYIEHTQSHVTELGFEHGRKLPKNTVLFVCIGSTIGKVAQLIQSAITNQQINSIVVSKKYKSDFIYSELYKLSDEIKLLASNQAVPIINKKTFGNIQINVTNIDEQEKVGKLFKYLDKAITLHQRKLVLLKQLKKGLLQKMFADKDSKRPILRFNGFTDDWEQRKLGDVVNFFSGLTYHPSDVKNKGYFVIRSSNIQNNQIVSADDIFVNKDIINVPNVKQGDIIVVVRNGSRKLIGKHAQVLTDMPNTVIGAFMTGVRSKSNFYINALLDSDQFQKEIYKNLGATINQITIGEFRKMRFIITSGNEAQTIGEFFKKIDTLITLQQQKLAKYQSIKKSLLQQMFI